MPQLVAELDCIVGLNFFLWQVRSKLRRVKFYKNPPTRYSQTRDGSIWPVYMRDINECERVDIITILEARKSQMRSLISSTIYVVC